MYPVILRVIIGYTQEQVDTLRRENEALRSRHDARAEGGEGHMALVVALSSQVSELSEVCTSSHRSIASHC